MTKWPEFTVGELCQTVGGGTPTRTNPDYYGDDIPWVTPKDMKVWDIERSQIGITHKGLRESAARLVESGSILLVVRSGVLKHTLPVGIARRPVAINQDMKALLCDPRLNPDYLARFLKWKSPEILRWVRATTADNFSVDKLKQLAVPLPPQSEQRRIAAVLDQADALRTKRREALAKTGSLTQAIFVDMFGRFEIETTSDQVLSLSELVATGDRVNYGVIQPGEVHNGGVPLIRAGDLDGGGIDVSKLRTIAPEIDERHKRSRLNGDEILISCVGSIGQIALANELHRGFNIARAVARVRLGPMVNRRYLASFLSLPRVQNYFTSELRTVAQPTLNIRQISDLKILVPELSRQVEFADRATHLDTIREKCRFGVKRADSLIASLQSRAFAGEL